MKFLIENRVVPVIDPFMEALRQETDVNHDRLYDLGKSFAKDSPNREPVKFGIAVLGLYGQEQDKDIFRTLGRHDEFTLFCAVALANASENGEEELWELAKQVEGWGRIHLVERLTETRNPEIQDWLLREGYKNSVMYEYLGYSCAVGGNLLAALQRDVVDDQLLGATGEIIQSLISGGPAASLDDYEDGAAVVELYLGEMEQRASSLAQFLTIRAIREFLGEEKADWQARASRGWTPEKREAMLLQCSAIIVRPEWREKVLAGLKSADELEFSRADQASSVVGIDAWPYHWDRVQQKPLDSGRWFHVMKSCPPERIAEVIALAEAKIPLGRIATGPGTELGLGPGYEAHGCLDCILQDLDRYPGQGLRLIEAGLQSPVVRNRNMALKALVAWGRNTWPADLALLLEHARQREPEADVRRWIENAMAGKPLEEGETPDE